MNVLLTQIKIAAKLKKYLQCIITIDNDNDDDNDLCVFTFYLIFLFLRFCKLRMVRNE